MNQEAKTPIESMIAAIRLLLSLCQEQGVDLNSLLLRIESAWESGDENPGMDVDEHGNLWFPDGLSIPDENGACKIRAIEDFRKKLEEAGEQKAADAINKLYMCIPSEEHVVKGSAAHVSIVTNCGNSAFLNGMGLFGGYLAYRVFPNPKADPESLTYRPGSPPFTIDRREKALEGVYCIDSSAKTVPECVEFMKRVAKLFMKKDEVPGPGFGF